MTGLSTIRKDSRGKSESFLLEPEQIHVDDAKNGRFRPASKESIKRLAADIMAAGQLQPALVKAIPPKKQEQADGKKFELVYGFRRVKACAMLGVPVRVELTDVEDTLVANVRENLERDSTTPLDDAHNMRRLKESGMKVPEIAKIYNLGKSMVYATMSLLDLPEDLLERVADGTLSATAAMDLVSAPDEVKQAAVDGEIRSVQDVRDATRKLADAEVGTVETQSDDDDGDEEADADGEEDQPRKKAAKKKRGRPKKDVRAASRKELLRVILMMSEQTHPQLQAIGKLLAAYADGQLTEAGVQRKLKAYGRKNPGGFEEQEETESDTESGTTEAEAAA